MKSLNWTRPISPHLLVYKTEVNSFTSILNRIFSVILLLLIFYFGLSQTSYLLLIQNNLLHPNSLHFLFNLLTVLALLVTTSHSIISLNHLKKRKISNTLCSILILLLITLIYL